MTTERMEHNGHSGSVFDCPAWKKNMYDFLDNVLPFEEVCKKVIKEIKQNVAKYKTILRSGNLKVCVWKMHVRVVLMLKILTFQHWFKFGQC